MGVPSSIGAPAEWLGTAWDGSSAAAKDHSADVAAAAAATLCRGVKPSPDRGAAELRASRLGASARERLRTLALDEHTPLADRLDLIGCLRVAATPQDQKVLDRLAEPLLGGIYAADPESLSLRSTFPQFLEMEEKYGSVLLGLKKRYGPKDYGEEVQKASGARYSLFVTAGIISHTQG